MVTERWLEDISVRTVYYNNNSSETILFLNGIGANSELINLFVDRLSEFNILTLDVPGIGYSKEAQLPKSMDGYSNIVKRVLDLYGFSDESIHLMGISWGGILAQNFAYNYSSYLKSLILISTSTGVTSIPPSFSVFKHLLNPKRYYDKGYILKNGAHIYGGILRKFPRKILDFINKANPPSKTGYIHQLYAASAYTSYFTNPYISTKTLVIQGTDDPIIPEFNSYILTSSLPTARSVVLDKAGHLFLFLNPDKALKEIKAHISSTNLV